MPALRSVHPGALPRHRHETPERRLRRRAVQPADGSQRYEGRLFVSMETENGFYVVPKQTFMIVATTPPGGQKRYSTGTFLLLKFRFGRKINKTVKVGRLQRCSPSGWTGAGVSLFRPMGSAASVCFQKAFKFENVAVVFQWEQNSHDFYVTILNFSAT